MTSLAAVADSEFVNRMAKPDFYGASASGRPEAAAGIERTTYQRPAYWRSPAVRQYPAAPATVMGGGAPTRATIITLAALIALTALIIALVARGGCARSRGGCARGHGCRGARRAHGHAPLGHSGGLLA